MADPSKFQIARVDGAPHQRNAKINFSGLYLHQIHSSPTTEFGKTAVHNWPVYDGQGPGAKLVARAIGMQTNAASGWSFNTFSMLFEVERFKGSTLQIMGTTTAKDSEWAVVGGTGEFALADGVIKRKLPTPIEGGEMQELTIDGVYRMKNIISKLGPWGIEGSNTHDIKDTPQRLESVTVRYGWSINAISFSYTDKTGKVHEGGPFGTETGGKVVKIVLAPGEYVMEVKGIIDNYYKCLATFVLVTNIKTYEHGRDPGTGNGTPFNASVPKNGHVVGFFGTSVTRGGETPWVSSIGVYVIS